MCPSFYDLSLKCQNFFFKELASEPIKNPKQKVRSVPSDFLRRPRRRWRPTTEPRGRWCRREAGRGVAGGCSWGRSRIRPEWSRAGSGSRSCSSRCERRGRWTPEDTLGLSVKKHARCVNAPLDGSVEWGAITTRGLYYKNIFSVAYWVIVTDKFCGYKLKEKIYRSVTNLSVSYEEKFYSTGPRWRYWSRLIS